MRSRSMPATVPGADWWMKTRCRAIPRRYLRRHGVRLAAERAVHQLPGGRPRQRPASGHRRCNFVWYRPAEEATELRRLLTDADGQFHALGIPPLRVRGEIVVSLHEASRALLAPQLDQVVRLTPQPFLQPIFDVESPRMAAGRVAIIGDAAYLARPHVAAGVTKAAEDAMALANALRRDDDIARRLPPSSTNVSPSIAASCSGAATSAAICSRIC